MDSTMTPTFAAFAAACIAPAGPSSRGLISGGLIADGYRTVAGNADVQGTGLGCTQSADVDKQTSGTRELGMAVMVRPHLSTDPHIPPRGRPN